jgi:DNA gyrase inhibitor GyrI
VVRINSDDPDKMGLETGVIPGGWYVRRKLTDWQKKISKLPSHFDEMARSHDADPNRPSLEFYRSQEEMQLFLPVKNHPQIEAT